MINKKKDTLFQKKTSPITPFQFNEKTTSVFDDMINRSIPLYKEILQMISDLAALYYQQNTTLYDIGCSTGSIFSLLKNTINDLTYIGIDNSPHMINEAKRNHPSVTFSKHDLNLPYTFMNASVVISNLTIQFIHIKNRKKLLHSIYNGLQPKGCFILIEKIIPQHKETKEQFKDLYYKFKKRNNYSDLEIKQKEKALKNILTPLTLKENIDLLHHAGFTTVDPFFLWYNFAGIIGIKQ